MIPFLSGRRRALLSLLVLLPGALASARAQDARLSNLAIRAQAGGDTLITGFTVGAGANKTVLIRAVGPTLAAFGVAGTLPDPKLELYSGANKIAENDNWRPADAAAFAGVGAFPLAAGSRDAALLIDLAPGSYTAQLTNVGAGSGVALVEVYEITGGSSRLVNLSTRAQVGTGGNILIPGLTISGNTGTRRLLLRAVGPTLGAFGVPGTLADPKLELYSGANKVAENDNWGTPVGSASTGAQLAAAFAGAGAFALPEGSRDAALLANLAPGSYTLQVSGVGNTVGAALVEVYDVSPAAVTPSAVAPAITAQPAAVSVASGQSAVFAVAATGSPAPSYQWRRNGTAIPGATGSSLRLAAVDAALAGNYDVVVANAAGSVTSAAAALTVTGSPAAVRIQASATTLAVGANATFTSSVTGVAATGYQWLRDGTAIPGATAAAYTLANATVGAAGAYSLRISTANLPVVSPAVAVTVLDHPTDITMTGGQLFTVTGEGVDVAAFHALAPDDTANFTYTLVAGTGGEDNGTFRIVGNKLRTALPLAGISRPVLSIRVRATDAAGRTREQAFSLRVVDARGIPAIFRISTAIPSGPLFPVVDASLFLDLDVEEVVVQWFARLGTAYAVEISDDGNSWRLAPGGRYVEQRFVSGLLTYRDPTADFFLTRQRFYRVRQVDIPIGSDNRIEPPSLDDRAGLPALVFNDLSEIIVPPQFDLPVSDPTGRVGYYEAYTPGSIGPLIRTTNPSRLRLPISRNWRQGQELRLAVFGYTWGGQLVAVGERNYRVHFNEADFPYVPNLFPAFLNPRHPFVGLANVYGSTQENSLRATSDRTDRASGSRILDLVFDRPDGGFPNYGSFRLLLPRGLVAGTQLFSSKNAPVTGSCSLQAGVSDNVTLFSGGNWSHVGDFYFNSVGPLALSATPDNTVYGSFEIRRVAGDPIVTVWEIKCNYGGTLLGTIYFIGPRT